MKFNRILALDPATKCGWAHSDGFAGVWDLSIKNYDPILEGSQSAGIRIAKMYKKIDELYRTRSFSVIIYEAAHKMGPKQQQALIVQSMLQGAVLLWCEFNRIAYAGVSPAEIKKHATGKGNCDKAAMIKAAEKKWPKANIIDDNMADALWILDFYQSGGIK